MMHEERKENDGNVNGGDTGRASALNIDPDLFAVYKGIVELYSTAPHSLKEKMRPIRDAAITIVLVGTQSAGKSSVLEQILGFPATFKHKITATRCPVLYKLNFKEDQSEPRVTLNSEAVEPKNLPQKMEKMMKKIETDGVDGFSDTPAVVEVWSSDVPNLVFVDLPGIRSTDPSDVAARNAILRMIEDYVKRPNTYLLVVSPVEGTDESFRMDSTIGVLDDVDPNWTQRATLVLSKADHVDVLGRWKAMAEQYRTKGFEAFKREVMLKTGGRNVEVVLTSCHPFHPEGGDGIPTTASDSEAQAKEPHISEFLRRCKEFGYEKKYWSHVVEHLHPFFSDRVSQDQMLASLLRSATVTTLGKLLPEKWEKHLLAHFPAVHANLREVDRGLRRELKDFAGLADLVDVEKLRTCFREFMEDVLTESVQVFQNTQSRMCGYSIPALLGRTIQEEIDEAILVSGISASDGVEAWSPATEWGVDRVETKVADLLRDPNNLQEKLEDKLLAGEKGETQLGLKLGMKLTGSVAVSRFLDIMCYLLQQRDRVWFTHQAIVNWAGDARRGSSAGPSGEQALFHMVRFISLRAYKGVSWTIELLTSIILQPLQTIIRTLLGEADPIVEQRFSARVYSTETQSALQSSIQRLAKDIDSIQKQLPKKEQEADKVKARLTKETETATAAKERWGDSTKAVATATQELSTAENTFTEAQQALAAAEAKAKASAEGEQKTKADNDVNTAKARVDTEKKTVDTAKGKLEAAKQEAQKAAANKDDAEKKKHASQQRYEDLSKESETLKSKIHLLSVRKADREKRLKVLQERSKDGHDSKSSMYTYPDTRSPWFGRFAVLRHVEGAAELCYQLVAAEVRKYAEIVMREWERSVSRAFARIDYSTLDQCLIQILSTIASGSDSWIYSRGSRSASSTERKEGAESKGDDTPFKDIVPEKGLKVVKGILSRSGLLQHIFEAFPSSDTDFINDLWSIQNENLKIKDGQRQAEIQALIRMIMEVFREVETHGNLDEVDLVTAHFREAPSLDKMKGKESVSLFNEEAHRYYYEVMSTLVPQLRWLVNAELVERFMSDDIEGLKKRVLARLSQGRKPARRVREPFADKWTSSRNRGENSEGKGMDPDDDEAGTGDDTDVDTDDSDSEDGAGPRSTSQYYVPEELMSQFFPLPAPCPLSDAELKKKLKPNKKYAKRVEEINHLRGIIKKVRQHLEEASPRLGRNGMR